MYSHSIGRWRFGGALWLFDASIASILVLKTIEALHCLARRYFSSDEPDDKPLENDKMDDPLIHD